MPSTLNTIEPVKSASFLGRYYKQFYKEEANTGYYLCLLNINKAV